MGGLKAGKQHDSIQHPVAITLPEAVSKVSRALVGLLVHSRARLLEKDSMDKQASCPPAEDRNARRLLRRPVLSL